MNERAGHCWVPRIHCMRYFLTGVFIIIADQLTKHLIRITMAPGDSIPVLGDLFRITYVVNRGAAWGILEGKRFLLIVFTIVVICALFLFLRKHPGMHWTGKASLMMILSGGLGNLIDRTLLGSVTDMFDFSFFPPVFNVADIAVTCGCGLLILYVIMGERFEGKRG